MCSLVANSRILLLHLVGVTIQTSDPVLHPLLPTEIVPTCSYQIRSPTSSHTNHHKIQKFEQSRSEPRYLYNEHSASKWQLQLKQLAFATTATYTRVIYDSSTAPVARQRSTAHN